MNQQHYAYRAALRIDPIAAQFWQQHRTPTAGNRLREIAEIIEEEARTVDADARVFPEEAARSLVRAVEEDEPIAVIRDRTRVLKETLS